VPLRQGAPIVDCHDCFFSGEGRRIILSWDLVDFHAMGEGPRGHKTLHQVVVPEHVLDGVGKIRGSLIEVLLKLSMGSHAWCLLQPVASVACSAPEPPAYSLTLLSSLVVIYWKCCLCLFLPPRWPPQHPGWRCWVALPCWCLGQGEVEPPWC
jgi:hypothetical protein